MKKQKGITLIALVITIIVLIILAGVAINLGIGDNGIFNKAKLAKEKYNEESIREKVELGIMELEIDELILGNGVTIELVLQELLEKEIFETIDKDKAIGNIGEYEVKLKYNENQKVEIEYIAKATGVRVTYKLNPESYTNGETVSILLTVNGKVKSVTKPDNLVVYPENNTIAINYQVTTNGTYKFVIEDEQGNKQEKNVIVDTIDKLAPNDFTITAIGIGLKIKITAEATDANPDGTSIKSGIEKYEYFAKGESDSEYTKYEINEIEKAVEGKYSVYVIAYDKAGNPKTSNTVEVILEKPLNSKRYVDYGIDLNDDGDTTNDWMIFYEEDGTVNPNYAGSTYIIPAHYVPYSKMQKSVENAGMTLYEGSTYRVYWSTLPTTYVKNTNYNTVKEIFMYDYTQEELPNVYPVSRMLDTDYWKDDFVTPELQVKGGLAIGGPTINMWCASWNKEYSNQKIITEIIGEGYQVNGTIMINVSPYTGYDTEAPNIYFPSKTRESDGTAGYWIASPAAAQTSVLMGIDCDAYISYNSYEGSQTLNLRPLVYLPSTIKLIQDETNPSLYRINYGN